MNVNVINAYLCAAGHRTITRRLVNRSLPLTMTCRACVADERFGQVALLVTSEVDQTLEPSHEWYSPLHPDRIPDPRTRAYCQTGGLLLREVGGADYTEGQTPWSR